MRRRRKKKQAPKPSKPRGTRGYLGPGQYNPTRSVRFTDRKKKWNKGACRGKFDSKEDS